jgi:hypothetical protein
MHKHPPPTAEYLRNILSYDPETGAFKWTVRRPGVKLKADRAGSIDRHGHRQLRIDGRILFAHRLAFLYMTGEWPQGDIDHINGVRDDNRWRNLRDVPHAVNVQNRRKPQRNNTSGYLGVSWDKRARKWVPQLNGAGWLGAFDDPAEAHQAYLTAKRKFHPGCTI